MRVIRLLFGIALAFAAVPTALVGVSEAAREATLPPPQIITQAPCADKISYCADIDTSGQSQTIRSITFKAPTKGTAMVTFHGSMSCHSANTNAIELSMQITKNQSAAISKNGPGGMFVSPGWVDPGPLFSNNLNSTRTFNISRKGKQTYYFRSIATLADGSISCVVFDASFSVVFVPKS